MRRDKILRFSKEILQSDEIIPSGLELEEYHQYMTAVELITDVASAIRDQYGDLPWLDEWYLYV